MTDTAEPHTMHEFTRSPGDTIMRCACGETREPSGDELRAARVAVQWVGVSVAPPITGPPR